jgi:ornithine decarboxylase
MARDADVKLMTFDNVAELEKIAVVFPEARVILRIAVDDSKSICRFNSKFGAPPSEWDTLLRTARNLGLDVAGISFHVGSGCESIQPFADAVASARVAFDLAESYGHHPTIVDCGGGFPGTDSGHLSFHDVAATVSQALDVHFPEEKGVEIIAEPGRYMVAASHTYAVSVIAKRELSAAQLADASAIETFGARKDHGDEDVDHNNSNPFGGHSGKSQDPQVALYINDGVYGSFNCVVFDHAIVTPKVLAPKPGASNIPTKLFGPTCDSIDVVLPSTSLPPMNIGDWLYFPDMGAYTRCAASKFNGQGTFSVHYVWAGAF